MSSQTSVDGNGRGRFRPSTIMGCWHYGFKTYLQNKGSLPTSRPMVARNCALAFAATASGPHALKEWHAVDKLMFQRTQDM